MIRVDGLDGRVAVVTGAKRGIGKAIAETLAGNGAKVAALDLEAPTHPGILGVACDVSSEEAIDAAFAEVEAKLGTVSVLVLNAGIYPIVPFEETTLELWNRTMAINLTGAFLCGAAGAPGHARAGVRAPGGDRIVRGQGRRRAIDRRLRGVEGRPHDDDEVHRQRVREARDHLECPRARAHRHRDDRGDCASSVTRIPVGRFGTTDEVAALVAFLCSEHAGYITGEVTDINGGFLID